MTCVTCIQDYLVYVIQIFSLLTMLGVVQMSISPSVQQPVENKKTSPTPIGNKKGGGDPPPGEVTVNLCIDKVRPGLGLLCPDDMDQTLYTALKPHELDKIIKCRFCNRKFTFLSEHLVHMKTHTHNVDSIVEMSIKVNLGFLIEILVISIACLTYVLPY